MILWHALDSIFGIKITSLEMEKDQKEVNQGNIFETLREAIFCMYTYETSNSICHFDHSVKRLKGH